MKRVLLLIMGLALLATGCASAKPKPKPKPKVPGHLIEIVKYKKKTRQLMETARRLSQTRLKLEDQRYRLAKICVDYPAHIVCQPQTAAKYARQRFCADSTFTKHVDSVVKACHQGQCKQVDQASRLSRMDYMILLQKLPHTLVLFRVGKSNLDRTDRRQLQRFIETLQGQQGYFIIVGRASREGRWRKNVRLALDRAEVARKFIVETLGIPKSPGALSHAPYSQGAAHIHMAPLPALPPH